MMYELKTQRFEGPLHLLLTLTLERKLSINEFSLAKITQDYIAYVQNLQKEGAHTYEEIAEFLVVAATLMLLKSKSLLPDFQLSKEEEEEVGDLERRLKEYQRYCELALVIGKRVRAPRSAYLRPALIGVSESFLPPRDMAIDAFEPIMRRLMDGITPKTPLQEKSVRKVISIEEKMRQIEERITRGIRSFSGFVGSREDTSEIIVSFLALLELIRHRALAVSQERPFGDILIDNEKNHE